MTGINVVPANRTNLGISDGVSDGVMLNKWDAIIALALGCVAAIIYGSTVTPGSVERDR